LSVKLDLCIDFLNPQTEGLIRSRDVATFSTIAKVLAGHWWPTGRMLCRPGVNRST